MTVLYSLTFAETGPLRSAAPLKKRNRQIRQKKVPQIVYLVCWSMTAICIFHSDTWWLRPRLEIQWVNTRKNRCIPTGISETQKYGHVTYFWNGNRSGKFDDKQETYIEIPSDIIPFEQRPWMKAAEITDKLIDELRTGKYRFARVNYANGDM